eukprot:8434675-Pyramimonas_sp.AAC.1
MKTSCSPAFTFLTLRLSSLTRLNIYKILFSYCSDEDVVLSGVDLLELAVEQFDGTVAHEPALRLHLDQLLARFALRRRAVVVEVLLQREQRVRVAEVVDVARLGDLHEVLARAPLAVARRAPRGDVALLHQVQHHLHPTQK